MSNLNEALAAYQVEYNAALPRVQAILVANGIDISNLVYIEQYSGNDIGFVGEVADYYDYADLSDAEILELYNAYQIYQEELQNLAYEDGCPNEGWCVV